VRPLTLWRHEVRRAGWPVLLGPPVAVALGLAVALTQPAPGDDTTTARILLGVLEMAVPLAAGVGCASLVGRDPATEVQLSVPTPYRVTLLRRLAVTLAWSALVAAAAAALLVVTGWWERWPEHHGVLAGQLTWLAPTLGLGGLGFAAGALFRGPGAASAVVTTVWAFQQFFAGLFQEHYPGRLTYLFATTRGADPAVWTANRLTLIGLAVAFVALAFAVLDRRERLIHEGDQ
jgi:hypothetical protein